MSACIAPRSPAAGRAAAVSLAFAVGYAASNHLTGLRSDVGRAVFDWERAIPFVPWTIVPYLSIVVFFVLSFFVGHERRELERHALRLLLLLALALACYAACPLAFAFERPPVDGVPGLLFELLGALDRPYNRAPSLHIGVLLLLWVRFRPHLRGAAGVALQLWFVLIALSVLTTWQHHVIDIPAGAAAAGLCLLLTRERRAAQPIARSRCV